MLIAGIDPGPEQSALVLLAADVPEVTLVRYLPNAELEQELAAALMQGVSQIGIEWMVSYQKAVGQPVFQTCRWVGRFESAFLRRELPVELISNVEIRQNLCHVHNKCGAAEIRAALIDRFGGPDRAVGVKKRPGPLYELKSGPTGKIRHLWSALAVAVTLADRLEQRASTELRGSPVRGAPDRPS